MESVVNGKATPQPTPTPVPQAAPLGDEDFVTGAGFRREASTYFNNQIAPQLQQIQAGLAQTAIETVRSDPRYAPIFQKYGPEVLNKLASVDKSMLNVDNVRVLVNLVKADHVDEIASDIASQRISEMQPTFRSTGAAPAPVGSLEPEHTLKSERLPADYRERLAQVNMTESALNEFLRGAYPNLDREDARREFFKMAEKTGGIITEVSIGKARSGD